MTRRPQRRIQRHVPHSQRHVRGGVHGRSQRGFALLTVLALMTVTALIIGALFGLMLTTLRVTESQERTARELRAADAAIETAINKMRTQPCDASAPRLLPGEGWRSYHTETFDQGTQADTSDDVQVAVGCASVPGTGASSTDQVRIVGADGYRGSLSSAWTIDCAASAVEGCMPWTAAVGSVPAGLARSGTSLIHSGPEPLRFSSGVTVRRGAAALRRPLTTAEGTQADPAIEVGGQYNQGSRGILGTSATDCGMLDGDPGNGAGRISDLDLEPGCGVSAAATVDPRPTDNASGLVASTAVPTVPGTCPPTPVVTFTPGTYSRAQTAAVSRLTDGSLAVCRNKTFHFAPGIYSFQGDQLVFGDRGSFYVFGAPSGWDSSGGVQSVPSLVADRDAVLCDPGPSGTSLVLAGWTRLTHNGGRVAICPARPAGQGGGADPLAPHPAIYQQTAVPTGVQVTSINRSRAPLGIGILPFKCRVSVFAYPTYSDIDPTGACRPQRTYDLYLSTDGQAPVSSLRVMLTGTEDPDNANNLVRRRQTRFRIHDAANALLCSTDWVSGAPNGGFTSSFDLKSMPGSCSTTALNQSQLNGGRIAVDHQLQLDALNVTQTMDITGAQVEIDIAVGQPGQASSDTWNDPDNVLVQDGLLATPKMPCPAFACSVPDPDRTITPAQPFVHEMTIGQFDFTGLTSAAAPDADPSLRSLRALVKVDLSASTLPADWRAAFPTSTLSPENFLVPVRAYLELRTSGDGRCIVQGTGINSSQELSFDLLDPNVENPDAPDCNRVLFDEASDLADVTVKLRFEVPCVRDYLNNRPNLCLRQALEDVNRRPALPVWQFRPPSIDSVNLTAVTDTYTRSETSKVTVDATAAATGTASFNVYGRTWMPLADLDIVWQGPATTAPLFANDLVLHGMGSRMVAGAEMGNVCCEETDDRTVNLVAVVDGQKRIVSRVAFGDVREVDGVTVPDMGREVEVLRWQACRSRRCDAPG